MNSQPLVSVIIGLYNVERFLEKKCLRDITQQTYTNLEIILVDDGSTDATGKLIDELSTEDTRIRVIHKQNGGVSSARNAGLDIASGEFIYFCDVDDDLDLTLIEQSTVLMQKHAIQMLIFGFNVIYANGSLPNETVQFEDLLVESNDELKEIILSKLLDILPCGNGFLWNKFYRRDFIERYHFRFDDLLLQQDEVFNIQMYPKVERLYVSSAVLYDYYIYGSGNNRARYIPNRFNIYHSIYKQLTNTCTQWGIMDQHCHEFITEKFYKGLIATFLDNPYYKGCPYRYKDRKREFKEILSNPDVQDCLANMEGSSYFKGIKSILYYWLSYRLKSYEMLTLLRWLFNIGDRCREMLKNVLK